MEEHIKNAEKSYYEKNYTTLEDFLKTEIDKKDYQLIKKLSESLELNTNIDVFEEQDLREIFLLIYDGKCNCDEKLACERNCTNIIGAICQAFINLQKVEEKKDVPEQS